LGNANTQLTMLLLHEKEAGNIICFIFENSNILILRNWNYFLSGRKVNKGASNVKNFGTKYGYMMQIMLVFNTLYNYKFGISVL
jgi:hypothetical protein